MASGALFSEPLNQPHSFNWVYLVELLVCGILSIFFLFYFNRLFATIVSYGIRAYTWHHYRAYIDIQALQISLLGGRVFFKSIRYHGHNQTILVHGGYVTWQYWIRKAKKAELFASGKDAPRPESSWSKDSSPKGKDANVDKEEKGGSQNLKNLPCRISIKVSGVEAFLYNRGPAYDAIVENMFKATNNEVRTQGMADGRDSSSDRCWGASDAFTDEKTGPRQSAQEAVLSDLGSSLSRDKSKSVRDVRPADPPAFLQLFPIHIECNKGAIVVGNENTTSILTAQFEKATGEFDAARAGPLDVYQQLFKFDFTHPVVHMRPNPDFKSTQLTAALRLKDEAINGVSAPASNSPKHLATLFRPWRTLRELLFFGNKSTDSVTTHSHSRGSVERGQERSVPLLLPGQERWQGLSRYLDQSQHDEHDEWDSIEYARTSLIADCPSVKVSFYWDVPGPVPLEQEADVNRSSDSEADVNGSTPPAYGLDLQIYGGIINYGPWADRQRVNFQSVFFPASYFDAVPAKPLLVGETRISSVFKLYLIIEDDTVLRIPIREPSKDWKWKGRAQTVVGETKTQKDRARGKARRRTVRGKRRDKGATAHNMRPFGWFDVKVMSNSTVNYVMDMVASRRGYKNSLSVDVSGSEISSSVNHGLLWRSGSIGLNCDLSNPVRWNALRKWTFGITSTDLDLFLLRDHMFLLVDLVNDWSSGPPPDFFTFTPYQYLLNLDFSNFKLYLNTNDCNIVNDPSDLDDNNFVILSGDRLQGELTIPLDNFRPVRNEIKFDIKGEDLALELCMPSKNTVKTFVGSKNVARLGELALSGSHNYFSHTSPELTDRLYMDIRGNRFTLYLYGFLVRHFMKIKDNYFGEDMHFKTLEEYQGIPRESLAAERTDSQASNKSNDLDVILCITANDAAAMLPANLYTAEDDIKIDIPFATADLRFTNYYMDLMVDFSPLHVSLKSKNWKDADIGAFGQTEIFIQSLKISGHRLFGLPPVEPTYVCNWDFDVGNINGECSSEFVQKLAGAARGFAFSLDDDENALPVDQPLLIHDATFLRLRTEAVRIWLHIAQEALLVSTDPICLNFNDLAGSTFSSRLKVWVPNVMLACVDARSAARHRAREWEDQVVQTHAYIRTTLSLNLLVRKLDFTHERDKQQAHMREHDQRTNRTPFLLMDSRDLGIDQSPNIQSSVLPPASIFPPIPSPIRSVSEGPSIFGSDTFSANSGSFYTTSGKRYTSRIRSKPGGLSQTRSYGSLKDSIRSNRGQNLRKSHLGVEKPDVRPESSHSKRSTSYTVLPNDNEIAKRGLPPSSIALRSALITPYFPLDVVQPDLSDVPVLYTTAFHDRTDMDDTDLAFNDVSGKYFDEDFVHRSFIVTAEPGLQVHCTPKAVTCIANLVDAINPRTPTDLLDAFQTSVMSHILDLQKRKEGKGKSNELSLKIPSIHIRFVDEYDQDTPDGTKAEKDQYDLILGQLSVAARLKEFPAESADRNITSLHTTLGALAVSVKRRSQGPENDEVGVRAEINDLLLWIVDAKSRSINVSYKAFETSTATTKIKYLASLIHRTTLLVDEFRIKFAKIDVKQMNRLRFLAYSLTMSGNDIPDPPFLTRPSYALRVAKDHLRNHDSWKIISRFRYIWQNLSKEDRQVLALSCAYKPTCVSDAEEKVMSSWDQWRTWDLAHVKKSFAMRKLYGSMAGVEKLVKRPPGPLLVDIRAGSTRAIIDPGPRQSEVFLGLLSFNVVTTPPSQPSGLMLEVEKPTKSTLIQTSCKSIAVRVNWEICELIEKLLELFQTSAPHMPGKRFRQAESDCRAINLKGDEKKEVHQFQVVVCTEHAKLHLESIHIRAKCMSEGLKLSLLLVDTGSFNQGMALSTLCHANTAASEVQFRSRFLMRTRADSPSIYVSQSDTGAADQPGEVRIAGACKTAHLGIKDEILGLVEAADTILMDEIKYLRSLLQTLEDFRKSRPSKASKPKRPIPEVTVALLMDRYYLDLALLQSLTWSISGGIGRLSITPALQGKVSINVDFDLDGHKHKLLSKTTEGIDVIAALNLPPVNGHLAVNHTNESTTVDFSSTIQTILFEASAIQGLLTTINKPEMPGILRVVQEDIAVLKSHAREVFPEASTTPVRAQPETTRPFLYHVNLTLAGLEILASAPGQSEHATANFACRIASVHFNARNTSHKDQAVLLFPEIHGRLQRILIELTLADGKAIRHAGNISLGVTFHCTVKNNGLKDAKKTFRIKVDTLQVNAFADTASASVDVLNHLQDKIKNLDLKDKKYLRRLRQPKKQPSHHSGIQEIPEQTDEAILVSSALFTSAYSVELVDTQISWIVGSSVAPYRQREIEDLVLSLRRIALASQREDAARLRIEDMQLQMVPVSANKQQRSLNSALLPEVVFDVAYGSGKHDRKLAFAAKGKSLDLRLESRFILPANVLQQSIALAGEKFRSASAMWTKTSTPTGAQREGVFGKKRLSSLLIDADFAGAVVHLQGSGLQNQEDMAFSSGRRTRPGQRGRYGQFVTEGSTTSTSLRAPGVAFKVQYRDQGNEPSLNVELKVDASSNTLYPTVVPLLVDISNSIKEVVKKGDGSEMGAAMPKESKPSPKSPDEDNIITADPSAILGRTRLNLGIRICKQEFSLSCQPIARVAATARFKDVYVAVNSVRSVEHGHFFAISAAIEKLQASVQHVYSRESTFSFDVQSIVLSLMNSKHLSGTSGISAILKINPMKAQINARQLQDFLLFREIWIPPEVRQPSKPAVPIPGSDTQEYLVQRYHQVAAAAAFPWNANVAIEELLVELDLGQALGKSSLKLSNVWASSKKNSNWEQNLCVGAEKIGVESVGRLGGFVELSGLKVRTSISWPEQTTATRRTPLIQASVGFDGLRVKVSFDYQLFAVADIETFDFLMYNVREQGATSRDRLVAILNGDKVQVFCTSTSAAQGLALFQALERVVQENQSAYAQSLKDLEKYLRRKSSLSIARSLSSSQILVPPKEHDDSLKAPISLHTDVVVTLRAVNIGAFPSTLPDHQILILQASDAQARFAAALENGKVHSGLGMTLGQLSVALASVSPSKSSQSLGDATVEEVVAAATSSRGGTILRVPKVIAIMQTWQAPDSNHIDYIFKSSFEGKVDVGWNYSRIAFIRNMWTNHSRSLASRLGKPLPESAVKITAPETPKGKTAQEGEEPRKGDKITAVVNVPQSKYDYTALEPPIIETPQLRDMGEATPPLEWIGLHRDRLPNVTHQIVIVTLLEVAKEVEDAYGRILGAS